jgi:hypothetical protein
VLRALGLRSTYLRRLYVYEAFVLVMSASLYVSLSSEVRLRLIFAGSAR